MTDAAIVTSRRRMTACFAAALATVAVAIGGAARSAHAEGAWSIAEADPAVAPIMPASLAADGRLLAAGTECDATSCSVVLTTHPSGGDFERVRSIPGQLQAFAALRAGGSLVLTSSSAQSGLTAYDVSPAGRVVLAMQLERSHAAGVVAASDRRGTAAVAWLTTSAPWRLRVRVRRRDAAVFGPGRTVARFRRAGEFGNAALALGPRGEVAVLWASDGALHVRVLRGAGSRFGPALRVGYSDRVARISATYTARGTLAAIWSSADGGEEQNRVAVVRAAGLRPEAQRFSRGVRLGEGADRETLLFGRGTAVRAVAAGGTANVAWTSRSLRVRLATVHADGSVTAARSLDAPGVLVDAVGSPTGRALIAWTRDPLGPSPSARAVLRLTPARLGVGEPVGPVGSHATAAVLDDRATRALVSWSAGDPVLASRWGTAERRVP